MESTFEPGIANALRASTSWYRKNPARYQSPPLLRQNSEASASFDPAKDFANRAVGRHLDADWKTLAQVIRTTSFNAAFRWEYEGADAVVASLGRPGIADLSSWRGIFSLSKAHLNQDPLDRLA